MKIFGYESRDDNRDAAPFVRFVSLLQLKLPEEYAQHEPRAKQHRYLAINKAIQRALRDADPSG